MSFEHTDQKISKLIGVKSVDNSKAFISSIKVLNVQLPINKLRNKINLKNEPY